MNDMEILRRAYQRENDSRDRRPPQLRSWEYYTIGASRDDIRRLLDEGMLIIAIKTSTLTKYKLSEKGRDFVFATTMEREFSRVPAASIKDAMDLVVGFDDVKDAIARAIESQRRIHFLLEGPPACSKSIMLEGVRSAVPTAYIVFGSRTSAAGLSQVLFEVQPSVLLMDEADKMRSECFSILLGLMESGEILETKSQKALRNGTIVYTPAGPQPIELLAIGDWVCTVDGGIAPVLGVFPQGKQDIYEITFSDGQIVPCTKDHLWEIERSNVKPKVIETSELLQISSRLLLRTWVPVANKVHFTHRLVPMAAYALGALLGDGGLTREVLCFTTADEPILRRMTKLAPAGYTFKEKSSDKGTYTLTWNKDYVWLGKLKQFRKHHPWIRRLRKLGLWGMYSHEKFVPFIYKYNSEKVRWELIKGLMDTDGSVDSKGQPRFATTSACLAMDVAEIIESLGGVCSISVQQTSYLDKRSGIRIHCRQAYCLRITHPNAERFFTLERQRAKCRKKLKPMRRYINAVRFVGQDEATCIRVDHPRKLFLTEGFIPTHNTRGIKLETVIIAACNSSKKFPPEFLSRFALHVVFPKYTRAEFINVCRGFLSRAENCPADVATTIGTLVHDYGLGDVRKARGVWQLMTSPTEEEMHRVIQLMLKYSPDGQKRTKATLGSRMPGL